MGEEGDGEGEGEGEGEIAGGRRVVGVEEEEVEWGEKRVGERECWGWWG